VAILPGECLALANIDRQVYVLGAKAPLPPQHAIRQHVRMISRARSWRSYEEMDYNVPVRV
jgi:hypothetical protein